MKPTDVVKIFLLGMITAFLAVIALRSPQGTVALAGGGGASSGNIIAVTTPESGSLFIIDTANKQLAQYTTDSRQFRLRAARYFNYDLQLYDSLQQGMTVKRAKKAARDADKKRAKDD